MRSRVLTVVLAIALAISVIFNIYAEKRIATFERQPHSFPRDQPFVERAERLWALRSKQSVEDVKKTRYAQTFYLEDGVCVSLNLEVGSLGGAPVYCFNETGKAIYVYDTVD